MNDTTHNTPITMNVGLNPPRSAPIKEPASAPNQILDTQFRSSYYGFIPKKSPTIAGKIVIFPPKQNATLATHTK